MSKQRNETSYELVFRITQTRAAKVLHSETLHVP